MWRRRDLLRSSVIGLALGLVPGCVAAKSPTRQLDGTVLNEAAEVLGAVGAHGGALDALLHGRYELYAVARDQLSATHDVLISIADAFDRARPLAKADECCLVLRRLAAAADLQAERLDGLVWQGLRGPAKDLAGPLSDRRAPRIAAAAWAWRRACGGRGAEIEMILVGPLACALETARFSPRRDAPGKRPVLDFYASRFEAVLADAHASPELLSDPAALAAAAHARAAAAEALGLVKSARGAPARL